MENGTILPILTTAVSIGIGCGACCSPVISMFLSSYVISHADGAKKGVYSFGSFFLGKLISVTLLCMAASMAGRQFIGEDGYIGTLNLRLSVQIVMSCIGFLMAVRWFIENRKQKTCKGCTECGKKEGKTGIFAVFFAGLAYGCTPCAPLLLMIGYAFTLPLVQAAMTGVVFGLSSAFSPVLFLAAFSGALSRKMAREIPHCLKWFRLASYVLLMVMPFLFRL